MDGLFLLELPRLRFIYFTEIPLILLLDGRRYNTGRKEGGVMLTTRKTEWMERGASWLSRLSEKHPMGTFFISFLIPPVGLLLAVTVCTTLVCVPMSLLFGWI